MRGTASSQDNGRTIMNKILWWTWLTEAQMQQYVALVQYPDSENHARTMCTAITGSTIDRTTASIWHYTVAGTVATRRNTPATSQSH
eukprot:1463586-Amphidinium_carterae.2